MNTLQSEKIKIRRKIKNTSKPTRGKKPFTKKQKILMGIVSIALGANLAKINYEKKYRTLLTKLENIHHPVPYQDIDKIKLIIARLIAAKQRNTLFNMLSKDLKIAINNELKKKIELILYQIHITLTPREGYQDLQRLEKLFIVHNDNLMKKSIKELEKEIKKIKDKEKKEAKET